MNFEMFDPPSDLPADSDELKLGGFQNEVFVDSPMLTDLTPKIRFTTDAQEAEQAAQADRSNPLDLPDSVFYVEPKEGADTGSDQLLPNSGFQNDSFNITVAPGPQGASDGGGDAYCGPSSASLDIKIENATRDLTFAQLQLERAIETGTGVITAMQLVEHAQQVLDSYVEQHGQAVAAEAAQAANLSAKAGQDDGPKLGSVSHAQWELEQAYKSGNSIRIHNAERDLAHEKAKEKAKEMD